MKNHGEHKKLIIKDGRYYIGIDITVSEWKEMLLNPYIFDENSKNMILYWYHQEDYQATSKTITTLYELHLNASPYNGIVKGLGNRILKHLNYRFWVESYDNDGKESFWPILFDGWHIDFDSSNNFVWKLRDELITAIEQTPKFTDDFTSKSNAITEDYFVSIVPTKEGKQHLVYSTVYERNPDNRRTAIKLSRKKHGCLQCEACGFDFEKTYGERGKDFIEVHHNKPLHSAGGETTVDPSKDLNCLCSNCHRMVHRNKSSILTVFQLKKIIHANK